MNLLKQPLLTGGSGSERTRNVKNEDQREDWEEEGLMLLMLRQSGGKKDDRNANIHV